MFHRKRALARAKGQGEQFLSTWGCATPSEDHTIRDILANISPLQ